MLRKEVFMFRFLIFISIIILKYPIYLFAQADSLNWQSEIERRVFQRAGSKPLDYYLVVDSSIESYQIEEAYDRIETLVHKLEKKRRKYNDKQQFFRWMFYYIHRKVLVKYVNYIPFSKTIAKSGKYDCVSGTALYSVLLNRLKVKHRIYETNFHIYLTIGDDEEYLFESTDPIDGFVSGKEETTKRINQFLADNQQEGGPFNQINLNNSINEMQLAGLMYYNIGINLFNSGNIENAMNYMKKADYLYKGGERINILKKIFKQSLANTSPY